LFGLTRISLAAVMTSAVNLRCRVHPSVLFQIADAYERRSMENHRVIGTLVGSVDKQSIEVTNCFCVPHKEYEERVEADLQYAQDMFELNKKVAPAEQLVGWFATGSEITSHSALIHDYYGRETKDPVHLTVDTTLNSGKVALKGYVFVPIGVPGATTGSMFTPIPVEITATEPEVVGLDLLHKTKFTKLRQVEPTTDLARVSEGVAKLEYMLEAVITYVEAVLSGRESPDNGVGRKLLDLVNSVPKMSPDEFEKMVNSNMKDLLMVIYLTQLTKTQLQLNEKLTSVSVNQLKEYQKLLPE
jgi:translation initiation factor 3 subunit F